MRNKYLWIAVNLVLSLALFVYLIYGLEHTQFPANVSDSESQALLVYIIIIGLPVIWFFKTISVWKRVLREEDAAFDKAFAKKD